MSIFKYAIFSILLSVPLLSKASTITEYQSFMGASNPGQTILNDTDSTIVQTHSGYFADLWTLSVGQNDIASIVFNNLNLSTSLLTPAGLNTVDFLKISPFNVTPGENFGLTDLGYGTYHFLISGTTSGLNGGLYAVGTAVAAVPLPAAVWLFGSALLGFLSISKRRHQI